jgi:antitoxin component YwqK of YwqJK toxin-antitoxin module
MIMRFLFTTLFILCHGICLAQDLPGNQKKAETLTVKQAAEIVKKANETRQRELDLSWLTSIDQDVAGELSHYKGTRILLGGLTSIDANVAHELTKRQPGGQYVAPTKVLSLNGLTSITKDVAHELVKKANETQQGQLNLNWLTSIDQDVARELSHYGGQKILLDGLTSLTQDVAHELTKVRPGRFGWYNKMSLRSDIPAKGLSLDGLTSITKKVAHELAKCNGSLDLNYVKSMDSEVARELAKFKGDFLNIQNLESIAPEDMNILKDGLRGRGGSEKFYRAMMPYKLNDGTMVKKWNGKIIEYRKDGSKMREIDYKYGGVTLQMEWDEAGNLTKEKTFPVHIPRGVEVDEPGEKKELGKENLDSDLTFDNERFAPERKYPYDDLTFREGTNKERIAYAKDEDEPFTGVGDAKKRKGGLGFESRFLNGKLHGKKTVFNNDGSILSEQPYLNGKLHGQSIGWHGPDRPSWEKQHINGKQISDKTYFRTGSKRTETSFKDGKPVLKSTLDQDGNLIEKETY